MNTNDRAAVAKLVADGWNMVATARHTGQPIDPEKLAAALARAIALLSQPEAGPPPADSPCETCPPAGRGEEEHRCRQCPRRKSTPPAEVGGLVDARLPLSWVTPAIETAAAALYATDRTCGEPRWDALDWSQQIRYHQRAKVVVDALAPTGQAGGEAVAARVQRDADGNLFGLLLYEVAPGTPLYTHPAPSAESAGHEWRATGWVRGYEFNPGPPEVSAERMIEFGWEPVQHVPPSTPFAPPTPKAAAPTATDEEEDARRFCALQDMPAEKAQAFFWNYSSRKERARAIDKYIKENG